LPLTPIEKPLKICDKITPEFPLAPKSDSLAKASHNDEALVTFMFLTLLNPTFKVEDILEPVSPSGTGKTFKLLIVSIWLAILFVADSNIFNNVFVLSVVINILLLYRYLNIQVCVFVFLLCFLYSAQF
jgi:hypothetical protein